MPAPISFLPFGLARSDLAGAPSFSLNSSLPIIARHFDLAGGDDLLPRFQRTVSGLLERPEITSYLGDDHLRHLTAFLDLRDGGAVTHLDEEAIHALGTLHSLYRHYESFSVPASGREVDAKRRDVFEHLRITGPLSSESAVMARIASLEAARTTHQATSLMMSGAQRPPDSGRTSERIEVVTAAENNTSIPPVERRLEYKEIISDWVKARGGRAEKAIQRVLIANNGMSATRLVKSIRGLSDRIAIDGGLNPSEHRLIDVIGMASKSDLESGANYLGEVDRLVKLPVDKAGDVFLDYERILKVARDQGVDAIAVGWGFVAEKSDFVKMAVERGFIVIGPPHAAMAQLGGKISSKVLAEDAGVAVLPWTKGPVETASDAVRFAREHDYRVAIKADAGGGGKGIRLVKGRGDEGIDDRLWTAPIGTDVETRAGQMRNLLQAVGNFHPDIPTEEAFPSLNAKDQSLWIQILRLALILRRRREWLSEGQDEAAPETMSIIEEARALILSDPEGFYQTTMTMIVENHVAGLYRSASDEGKISFKDPTVFVEMLAPVDSRHIEIQVEADQHGQARAIAERDCSPQIDRQKMFEEGPAIFVPNDVRSDMRDAAVRVARKSGYTNLGTCEFLYSPSSNDFWFMEMNTRLQVEHPVTELLCGLDLVEQQLIRAMGVPLTESELKEFENRFDFGRHVIAARINAKDPDNGFAPSPGTITEFRLPETPNVRAYFSLGKGSKVSTSSDSQIGHVFASGETREQAISTLRRALEDTVVEGDGIKTTIEFSIDVLGDPEFQSGRNVNIDWLNGIAVGYSERTLPVSGSVALTAAAIHRFETELSQNRSQFQSDLEGGRPLNRDLVFSSLSFELPFVGNTYEVTVNKLGADLYAVTLGGVTVEVEVVRRDSGYVLTLQGGTHEVTVTGNDPLRVQVDGRNFEGATHDPTKLKSFTQGSVWKMLTKEGQRVEPGDALMILESMKMEISVCAEIAGIVRGIHVGEGDSVKAQQLLIEIEPKGGVTEAAKVPEVIRLNAEESAILHSADRLIEHVGRFPMERLQAILIQILEGASYQVGKRAKDDKTPFADEIIIGHYAREIMALRDLVKTIDPAALKAFVEEGVIPEAEGEDRANLLAVQSMLLKLREIVDIFVRDEQPFSKTANERAAYSGAGKHAFALAVSHAQLEAKSRLLLNALELAKALPYQAPLPSDNHQPRSLVDSLKPLTSFRTEAYRKIRIEARDMIEYASPRRADDPFETEEKILQAATMSLYSAKRNTLTQELIDADILSVRKILALLDHSDYEVRSVAGYVLLRRTYARHKVVDESFRLTPADRLNPEHSTWHYIDGRTGDLRVGVAVNVSPLRGTLGHVLAMGAELLRAERKKLDESRSTAHDTIEVIVSPRGLDDYENENDFLSSVRDILRRCFRENPPKHVKFTIQHENGGPTGYFMFCSTKDGDFVESRALRGLDPLHAHLLEMERWSDWDLTKRPNNERSVHVWVVRRKQGSEVDERLTARALVGNADIQAGPEGLTLPDLSDTYRRSVGVLRRELDRYGSRERPPMNHLFFNILPVIHADFDAARGIVEAAVAKHMEDRVSPLLKVEVLAKVRDERTSRGFRDVIFIINQSGHLASVRAFVVVDFEGQNYMVPWDRFMEAEGEISRLAAEDFKPMGIPHPMKTDLEKLRASRQVKGNAYVYDRPEVIRNELEDLWNAEGLTPPRNVFESTELVLKGGNLEKIDRGPMQNDRSMVAWHMKIRYPEDETPRDVVILSSDLTYENGTVSPKEGEFYDVVLDYAMREGIPFGQILEGFGARMGLDPNLALPLREGSEDIPPPLQFDSSTGNLYLTEEDYHRASRMVEPGSEARNLGDLVEGDWMTLPAGGDRPERRVFRVDTIIGGVAGLNTENLSQGSGRMAGALERAYESIPTMTIITDTVVGILTYLARIGRRVIQVTRVPQLLTGNRALNKLYNRVVFATNQEIGDGSVMLPNGVSQYGAKDERDGIKQFLQWSRYLPRRRGEEPPVKPAVLLDDRDVGRILLGDGNEPGVILDAHGKVQAYDPRHLIDAIFDRGEFQEAADQWARVVVAGRTRIGGVPVGVIGFDPRTQTLVVPADPTDPLHRERRVPQAGSVWHPDAAYKTAQMLFDFEREGLPKVILANVKGFPGGSYDMGPGQVTKFGAMIVESLVRAGQGRRLLKPTIVVVLPFGELRGGADVVVDSYLNRESLVMLMDEHGEMSVLPREGMYEVPAIGTPFKKDQRWPDAKTKKAYWDAVIAAHQTARRALHVGSVGGIMQTPNLRRDIHAAIVEKQREVAESEATLNAQAMLRAVATFANIPIREEPGGSLIVGAEEVFGAEDLEDLRTKFEELLRQAKARRG